MQGCWNHPHEGNICSLGVWDESNNHLYYSFSCGSVITLTRTTIGVMHAQFFTFKSDNLFWCSKYKILEIY